MNGNNRGLSIILGVLLMILGLIVLGAQVFTTLASVVFLGWMLLIGGIAQFVYGIFSGAWSRFFLGLIGGALTFVFGIILVTHPVLSATTIALLIGVLLLIHGIYLTISSLVVREAQWGWSFIGGIITLILGIVILTGLTTTGLYVIGLFIGIELFIQGFTLTLRAFTAPSVEVSETTTPYMNVTGAKGGKSKKHNHEE